MNPAFYVGIGGAAGAVARFLLGTRIATPGRATLAVNLIGSFVLGLLTGAAVGGPVMLAVGTGFCGAFTTFSTFAVGTTQAYTRSGRRSAGLLAGMHLVGAIVAVAVGSLLGGLLL